ncbi:MAG: exodeoxyribonuclease VII [Thermotogae bacterium]|nr:exodeoxyribonuclease VII [Thermotogota bacterium]
MNEQILKILSLKKNEIHKLKYKEIIMLLEETEDYFSNADGLEIENDIELYRKSRELIKEAYERLSGIEKEKEKIDSEFSLSDESADKETF